MPLDLPRGKCGGGTRLVTMGSLSSLNTEQLCALNFESIIITGTVNWAPNTRTRHLYKYTADDRVQKTDLEQYIDTF